MMAIARSERTCMQVWELHALLAEGVRSGEVVPLPWTIFGRSEMQGAFRYLASGAALTKPCSACGILPLGWGSLSSST